MNVSTNSMTVFATILSASEAFTGDEAIAKGMEMVRAGIEAKAHERFLELKGDTDKVRAERLTKLAKIRNLSDEAAVSLAKIDATIDSLRDT